MNIFTWFDRTRRALQNCIFQKKFEPSFYEKKFKKTLGKPQKMSKKSFFSHGRKTLDLSIKLAFFITYAASDFSKRIPSMQFLTQHRMSTFQNV